MHLEQYLQPAMSSVGADSIARHDRRCKYHGHLVSQQRIMPLCLFASSVLHFSFCKLLPSSRKPYEQGFSQLKGRALWLFLSFLTPTSVFSPLTALSTLYGGPRPISYISLKYASERQKNLGLNLISTIAAGAFRFLSKKLF